MDRPPIDSTIEPQSTLVSEGVAWLAGRVQESEGAASGTGRDSLASWRATLAHEVRELTGSQPAMAVFLTLGSRILQIADAAVREDAPVAEGTKRVLAGLRAWEADWEAASEAVIGNAQSCLPASGWTATYSHSSLVERALLRARSSGRATRVLLAEGRPDFEGRRLAENLVRAEISVWLAVDSALPLLLPQAGALLVGADAVRQRTFVHKAGTYALLLAARELNLPAYALAQRAKFLPDRCRRLLLPQRAAADVWADAPAGIHVVNLPFEEVPLGLVRGVVTESGVLAPDEASVAARDSVVIEELCVPDPPR